MTKTLTTYVYLVVLLVLVVSCDAPQKPTPPLKPSLSLSPLSFTQIPKWQDANFDVAMEAFIKSCRVFVSMDSQKTLTSNRNSLPLSPADFLASCRKTNGFSLNSQLFFETFFRPFVDAHHTQAHLTGYYTVTLRGSTTYTNTYKYPVFSTPADLISVNLEKFNLHTTTHSTIRGRILNQHLVPYYTRQQLESQITENKTSKQLPVLFWTDDFVARYMLHIQGGGIVQLANKQSFKVGYASDNGHDYVSVGGRLFEMGRTKVKYPSWRILEEPEHFGNSLQHSWLNPRYIFFRKIETGNIEGIHGVELLSEGSVAADTSIYPFGLPVWLQNDTLNHLTVIHDVGNAIKGRARFDFYFGSTPESFRRAASLNDKNINHVILVPVDAIKRLKYEGIIIESKP